MDSGAVLWYPESGDEMDFIKYKFPVEEGGTYHLGFKNWSATTTGATFADGTTSPGLPYYLIGKNTTTLPLVSNWDSNFQTFQSPSNDFVYYLYKAKSSKRPSRASSTTLL